MNSKEFNLRERAEIVSIAMECVKTLSSQELINYFKSKFTVDYNVKDDVIDSIIDIKYPKSNIFFRKNVKSIVHEYVLLNNRDILLNLFRDFFIFHNEANKITSAVDTYFNEWYDSKVNQKQDILFNQ